MRIRNAVLKAVEYRTKEALPTSRKGQNLRLDIENISSHVFGEHKNCARLRYFCDGYPKEGEENLVPELQKHGLFQKIEDVLNNLSYYADSLLYSVNSNSVESYNAIICKFIGGKRVNYGKRGSYVGRCSGAVAQHNTQAGLSCLSAALNVKVPETVRKLEAQRRKRVERTALSKSEAKKRRPEDNENPEKEARPSLDKDYGPNAQRPDLVVEMYEEQMKKHNERLAEWQKQRVEIERQTMDQAQSEMWLSYRKKLLTASNFGKVCRMRNNTLCHSTVKQVLYPQLLKIPALEYGRKCEATARKEIEEMRRIKIETCGLFIDAGIPYLGASPDGLIGNDGIVEIKCPFSAREFDPEEAIVKKIGSIHKMFQY